MTGRKSTCYH